MDEGMYGGGNKAAPVAPPESGGEGDAESKAPEEKSVDEQNAGQSEFLVSKKELPEGTKEGDTCMFKVNKDFGDEFSLSYVKEDHEKPPGEMAGDNMAEVGNDFAAMEKG
jgi:hypothetical protein